MRMPESPPPVTALYDEVKDPNRWVELFGEPMDIYVNGKYIHWDKLRHLSPPEGWTHREWWLALKIRRRNQYIPTPLTDKSRQPFQFLLAVPILEILHQIDLHAGGRIEMLEPITNPDTKDRYYVSSLIEESITSSQLEVPQQREKSPRR